MWDNEKPIKQAKMFLKASKKKESLVIGTTWFPSTFELLGLDSHACLEMLELRLVDATNLFLYYATLWQQFVKEHKKHEIEECLPKCYFCKDDGQEFYYHLLALKALNR